MKKAILISLAVFLAMTLSTQGLNAGQPKAPPVSFKAEFLGTEDGEEMISGAYFASPEGIRIEGIQEGEAWMMIINFQEKLAWQVMDEEKMYLETSFSNVDAEITMEDAFSGLAYGSPCPGEDVVSKHLGRENVQGRSVEKWQCMLPSGDEITVWYDGKLQVGIRVADEDGVFELKNIEEVSLPRELFRPPAGYEKFQF